MLECSFPEITGCSSSRSARGHGQSFSLSTVKVRRVEWGRWGGEREREREREGGRKGGKKEGVRDGESEKGREIKGDKNTYRVEKK